MAYQRRPTFRVHLAGSAAQGIPHADGLQPYNHQPNEVNAWVPLTPVFGSNSLTSESEPGLGDFHPFEAMPGQFISFYGNRCWHYTVPNETDTTRVSFDFRVVPFHLLDEEHCGPGNLGSARARGKIGKLPPERGSTDYVRGKPLRLGEYYLDSGSISSSSQVC